MTDQPARLEVTQADREAAANVVGFHGRQIGVDAEIRSGERDDHPLAQAFAAHRLAHTVPGDEGLREALKNAIDAWWVSPDDNVSGDFTIFRGGTVIDYNDDYDAAVEIMRELRLKEVLATLSTSPVIDTNEGLAERIEKALDPGLEGEQE